MKPYIRKFLACAVRLYGKSGGSVSAPLAWIAREALDELSIEELLQRLPLG
ncbi:hypothetical protein SBDP1_960013 [Syntrophobacter sp. SbD1]|nr:hypothetical protein SBDP1_960013 [Syntrophobacter sp. SbD1]